MGHVERKLREKENTKNKLLKAALDIAITEGWQAVTMHRISDAIEYTTSIIYEHFENKDALLREISNLGFRMLYKQFEKVLVDELEPKKQLIKLSLINWDFAYKNKELYQLMFSLERPPSNENASRGMALIKSVFAKLTGKSENEIFDLVLNWICLRQGSINHMMFFPDSDNDINISPRELYIKFIDRFISSIS